MTGEPFFKTRTITSERLISPLAGKRDLNDAAIAFKSAVHESISRPTLNVGLSIKALESASGNETYKDTDGKKRTNSGGTPGMVELPNGYSYDPNQKWEDGKVLKLFPSIKSRKSAIKEPNFGWIDKQPSLTADEYAKELAKKPQLRIRKYKVNKKTDEIIPESEQLLDPFSLSGGTKSESTDYEVKRLPGRTIGQRGRSLLARAASAFGIMVDENGKFRCPPGTPAANQFTDSAGTNCFGISASEILDFAKRMASGIDLDSDAKVKNSTKKLFEFVSWLDNGGIPGLGRTVWRDQDGNRIKNIKKWRDVKKTESGRVFVDGMIRGQDKLAQQDIAIASLMDMLGVVRNDEKRKTNDDVFEVFDKLRESGAWTVDTSTRLSPEDVDKIVKARLTHVPGFSNLSPDRQKKLIEADTERWYTTERALLEASLDSFIADPEHMRTISKINFQVKNPNGKEMDEASTEGFTTPDTKRLMSIINVDIPEIMNNQEAMIPSLAPNERIKIDFIGGKTDSESAKALTDFLVTVDGHSKQIAAMVEERAFARHIMKHEIAHTIQFQAFAREAERQIRTNGFINAVNNKGEMVRVDDITELNSSMVFSLMKQASDGIDLESLKNALSRADVVGFLAGDYPKMYFNDEYGAEVWALEATAELWALRDLGLIYGDDIDSALEWMDDISDGRYLDIRRRSDADGLRDIEARFYENRGPDPELTGNSIAEVKGRLEKEHKGRLSQIEKWSNDESTTSDDFVGSLAELEYRREALNAAYDNLEASGESKDSPQFKEINRKIKETNAYISLIEKKWAERFSSPDSDKRKKDMKSMRESVRQTMFAEGLLQPEEMAARARRQDIKNLKERADSMTADEVVQKLADIEISLKEPGISEGMKSELLEDKKIVRAIYKSRFGNPEDAKEWSKKRRELDTRIDEIVNPPRQQAIKKAKKVKSDSAAAKYAKKMQKENAVSMTADEIKAVERLGDPAESDIANLLDPDSSVSAVKNINRKYRRAQRSAGDLSPESESATLEDKIERTLIPVMEAMDESNIPDDIEIEAEMFFDVKNGFKLIEENLDNPGFLTGRIISEESPHKPGEVRDGNGEILARKGKEKSRVIVQVSKGDKGLFGTRETPLGEEGLLTIPPGKLRVVDTRPDGTIVVRVQEQDNVIDVLDRVSSSIGEEGPGASQNAKGTKKKIDRVANKYVAQRRENGLSSTPSKPKREVEIEDKNVEVKREVIKAGGSFGEPPSEDYVTELAKTPLIQPEEADIKPDSVDPKTGRTMAKIKSNMSVEELVNRRASAYRSLLDPDYANDQRGFQGQDRATLRSIDEELAKRGEIISNLPKPADFDPDHKPGSKKKAPYKTSSGDVATSATSGSEAIGVPQTREQRKEARTNRAQITLGDLKRILAGESPKEVTNDMSRDSLDPAVADEIARKSPEALIKDIEDAASEFHAGVDKRPRVRMTEGQLTKFANDGELLPVETDDIVLESGAIGRRLERRLNPGVRREAPKLSSGKRSESSQTYSRAESILAKSKEASAKSKERVVNLEKALDTLRETGEWRGGEFGVVVSNHPDWKKDIGKFDADTPPVNLTKEEIEKRFGSVKEFIPLVEEKLDRSRKETVLAEHIAKSKQVREEQNTLDVEDLAPEDFQLLLDEYEQLVPEDYGSAVIHVGQAELDGGVLDPSRTTGGAEFGSVGGVGNTGALNEDQISNLKRDNDRLKDSLKSAESIIKSLNDGEKTYTPENAREAAYLNRLLGVNTTSLGAVGFEEGIEYDLAKINSAGALSDLGLELGLLKPQITKNEQILESIQGEGKFGFVSAYPASEPINTSSYFGRNAGSVIPKDIATYQTELEAKLRQRSQYEDVKDREFLDRWMRTLRGSAYLVTDPSVITEELGPRSLGEKQILGKVKPIFSVSAPKNGYNPLTSDYAKRNEWAKAASALMARAIRLEKEGKEVNIENVISARKGEPLSGGQRLSSGALQSSVSASRTADILSRAKEKGIDIDYWEREQMPKFNNANWLTGNEQLERKGYADKLRKVFAEAREEGNDEKAEILNQLFKEVKNMTPEELNLAVEDALKRLPPQFSQQVSVQVSDPLGIIKRGRYLTQHDVEERRQAGIKGLSERSGFGTEMVNRSRSNTEAKFLNIDPSDTSRETRELRPASGFVTSRMSEERRAKKLKDKYGPDVEIQHPYSIGEEASKDGGDMTMYGTSRIILRPEVAERSLLFKGDSISDTGTQSEALKLSTADDSPYRGMWFNPVSILYADRTGDMNSIASPGSNLPRDGDDGKRYLEAMILGSFDTPDIAAIVASPGDMRDGYGKNSHVGLSPTAPMNVTSIIRTAEKRDEFKERGIDIVMDSPYFPLDEVEPFNPTMTGQWVQEQIDRTDRGQWKDVTFDEIVPDESTTPYEAWLRYVKTSNKWVFDHPDNEPGDDIGNKVNLDNMIDVELKRIESVKSKIGDFDSSSGKLSSGARVSPKQRKIQLQKVNDAENYLRNLDLQIAEVDLVDSETGKKIKSPIFSVAGRPMVLVDVNGIRIPFYQSTGKGGKSNPTGKWYPVFGVGKSDLIYDREFRRFVDRGGWFNKGDTYESIDNYYDVPEFKRIANILNDIDDMTNIDFHNVGAVASEEETLELLKKNGSTGVAIASSKLPKARMSVNDDLLKVINRDLTPYSTVGDAERSGGRRWDYINSVIDRIEKNRVKLDINSVSVAVDKDKLSVSKESNRIKNRDVQLTVKDKNGDAIKVSIESELETRFDDREVQNVTIRMKSNGMEVGVLYARTDIRGELGNQDKLTIQDVLVPEDYHRRGHGRLMLSLAEKYNIGSEKINHSSKLSELGELFAAGTGSGRLSSGARSGPSKTQRVAGIAGSRATGRVLDAVLKRSGADEDTRERVKYGVNMAGALAAGGPAGFATALAVDVSRRAGREIAERGLEEAVQRGKITQQQMDVAMQAVNRVAPNGLPDPVVDKLADAWSVASDFIDERVATDENMQRLDEFGDVIRASGSEFVTNAGEVVDSAREKIGKRFRRGKNNQSATDSFSASDSNAYKPAKTEFDDFSDPFSSGKRAGRSADVFRGEYNSRIGISKSTPNSAKPVSGYVVHRSHNEEKKRQIAASGKGNIGSDAIFEIGDTDVVGDGLTALGEIEVILKPEVSDRTSYGRGEALQSAHRPVLMNSSDADDIADALFNADGISSNKQNTDAMLHLLGAGMDKNFSSVGASRDENGKMSPVGMIDSGARAHEPFEAQILGGFKKNEVEGIHYPYSKVSKIAESEDISDVVSQNTMKSKLEKLGFTPEEIAYFYSMSGGKPINTASMTKLKEYRAAKKIKEQYEGMGIGYVKFAHPQGINIENPRSYDKTANQNARVDEILKKAIDAEIDVELKKTLDSIRKGQQLDLVVD